MSRPQGLRPASELAASRPHGDRLRYMAGCRCFSCRRANSAYESQRQAARKAGDWNGLVSTQRARQHIASLSAAGIGRRQVADASGVAETTLVKVISGERVRIRARSERAILAVTTEAAADNARVDAAPTWRLIDELLGWGYSKAYLARELGYHQGAIQFKRTMVNVRNAHEVQRLHARLRRQGAQETLRLMAELREEGYRQERIEAMVGELAARMGMPQPDLQVRDRHISAAAADLVRRLHTQLLETEGASA